MRLQHALLSGGLRQDPEPLDIAPRDPHFHARRPQPIRAESVERARKSGGWLAGDRARGRRRHGRALGPCVRILNGRAALPVRTTHAPFLTCPPSLRAAAVGCCCLFVMVACLLAVFVCSPKRPALSAQQDGDVPDRLHAGALRQDQVQAGHAHLAVQVDETPRTCTHTGSLLRDCSCMCLCMCVCVRARRATCDFLFAVAHCRVCGGLSRV